MNVTFDPAKDAINQAKHGVSLASAEGFERDAAVVWPDKRHDYDEARMVALATSGYASWPWCLLTARRSYRQSAASSV